MTELDLRHWQPTNLAPFAALNADPQVMRFMPRCLTRRATPSPTGRRGAWRGTGRGLWAPEVRHGAPFIGYGGLSVPGLAAPFMPCTQDQLAPRARRLGTRLRERGGRCVS